MKRFFIIAATTIILLITACTQPAPPAVETDVLEYSVRASETGFTADIVYRNEENNIITLENEPLPWSVTVILQEGFTGKAYLTAEVSEAQVFVPYLSGTADAASTFKLIDSTADFSSSGVLEGDKVFASNDPAVQSSALVTAVEDANTLQLNTDLFPLGTEPYYLYHKKTLDVEVKLNSEIIDNDNEENVRVLNCLVQTVIDM